MNAIIHMGEKSEDYLRAFENKRADYCLQDIVSWSLVDLKTLLNMLQSENRTFAEKETSTL